MKKILTAIALLSLGNHVFAEPFHSALSGTAETGYADNINAVITARVLTQTTRVVGGQSTAAAEFPFYVSLQRPINENTRFFDGDGNFDEDVYGSHSCGGTLIYPDVVITAAHCVESATPGNVAIEIAGKRRAVKQIVANMNYGNSYSMGADVAVIVLAEPVVGVTPIKLTAPDKKQPALLVGRGMQGTAIDALVAVSGVQYPGSGTNRDAAFLATIRPRITLHQFLSALLSSDNPATPEASAAYPALVILARQYDPAITTASKLTQLESALHDADWLTIFLLADNAFLTAPQRPRKTSLTLTDDATCRAAFGAYFYGDDFICTGSLARPLQNAPCYGDSGGPLLQQVDGEYHLIGIVSAGFTSRCGNGTDIYTKAASSEVDRVVGRGVGPQHYASRVFDYLTDHYQWARSGGALYGELDTVTFYGQCYADIGCIGLEAGGTTEMVDPDAPSENKKQVVLLNPADGSHQSIDSYTPYKIFREAARAGY